MQTPFALSRPPGPGSHRLRSGSNISLDRVVVVVIRTKIRGPAQRAKDVTNVISRVDALGESGVPAGDDAADDLAAGEVDVLQRGLEGALV